MLHLLAQLAPHLRSQAERAFNDLPTTLTWPTDGYTVFEDHSDASVTHYGGTVTIDSTRWSIEPGYDGRNAVDTVDVTWKMEIDVRTGEVRAIPTFGGIRVIGGTPNALELLCRAAGFGTRVVLEFGPLARLAPDGVEIDRELLERIGIDRDAFDAHVEAEELPTLRASLARMLGLA